MQFKQNVPYLAKGLAVSQISFSGGRVAASIANHGGLTHLNYYGAQRFGDVAYYRTEPISAWAQLFRPFVSVDGTLYLLEFAQTCIYPRGYTSVCTVGGVRFAHGLWLLNDALIYTVDVQDNPAGAKVGAMLMQTDPGTRIDKPTRRWEHFAWDAARSEALASATDSYPEEQIRRERERGHATLAQRGTSFEPEVASATTWIGITATVPLRYRETPALFRKYYFGTEGLPAGTCLVVAFGHQGEEALRRRLAELRANAGAEVAAAQAQYRARLAGQARIAHPNKTVQSLLANVAPVLDSLKVADWPGGMRAADSGYWIWGWDSMVHAEAHGFANDTGFMRDMLAFYRRTADPELGILHAQKIDGRPHLSMAFPAQCLYAVLLYHSYLFTGDAELLAEYLPFAHWILAQAAKAESGDSGLIKGVSLYPDQPEDLEQDGNDLSVFNNGIYYQALRAMSELAAAAGNTTAAAQYARQAARTAKGFQHFYDPEKGYYYDSLAARDFAPRRHYPLYAILWVTPFAAELLGEHRAKIAAFMAQHFPARHGLRLFPTWDSRFMYDGSQLGMYMPVVENFHRELQKAARNGQDIEAMFANMEWFWGQICIPEALPCEYANHGITVDNPGRKQAFCAKAWLTMFYHVGAGLNLGLDGLSFSPCDGGDYRIANLCLRGKRIDIAITGRGWEIAGLTLNGRPVPPPFRIGFAELAARNRIEIRRGGKD